jgi:hypothetical protein
MVSEWTVGFERKLAGEAGAAPAELSFPFGLTGVFADQRHQRPPLYIDQLGVRKQSRRTRLLRPERRAMPGSVTGPHLKWQDVTGVLVIGIAVVVSAVFGIARPAAGTTPPASTSSVSTSVGGDITNFASEVAGVQYAIAQIAQNWSLVNTALAASPPGASISVQNTADELHQLTKPDLEAVAGIAQIALSAFPDLIAQLQSDKVSDNIGAAAQSLQNAIGELATYTDMPNATTLDTLTSQFTTDVSQWDSAVTPAYRGASAPTIGGTTR